MAERRPAYESPEDLSRERAIILRAAEVWHAAPRKLPVAYGLDFALIRGREVVAWVEVKARNNPAAAFKTYLLSLHKWQRGVELGEASGSPFIVLVEFTDAVLWYRYAGERVKIEFAGRTDRDDWQDQEPCAMIPMKDFRPLNATGRA